MVLTINYDHPTLRWEPSFELPLSRSKSLQESLQKYIIIILVRNNESVAAVAHEPRISSAADGTFSNPRAYQVDVMSTNGPLTKYIDPYFENTSPGIDCKIVTGKPHKLSGDGKETSIWALALKIP